MAIPTRKVMLCALASLGFIFATAGFYRLSTLPNQPKTAESKTTKIPYGGASQRPLLSNKAFAAAMSPYPVLNKNLAKATALPGLQGAWSLSKNSGIDEPHKLIKVDTFDPQGLAVSEHEIFVSAYDHAHKANSIIYVMNKNTGAYIKTIVLQGRDHAGGIAYDQNRHLLWVAGHLGRSATLYTIRQSDIDSYDIKSRLPITYQDTFNLASISNASTVTYFQNAIWVGYFAVQGFGNIQQFPISAMANGAIQIGDEEAGHFKTVDSRSYGAITRLQGLAADSTHVLESSSFGSQNSHLVQYNRTTADELYDGVYITLPPYLEAVSYDGDSGRFYMLFESATPAYRQSTRAVVDRVLYIDPIDLANYAKPNAKLKDSPEFKPNQTDRAFHLKDVQQ